MNLVGRKPDQVPVNAMLGSMAWADEKDYVRPDRATTFTAAQTFSLAGAAAVAALGNAGAAKTIAWAAGNYQEITLDQTTTLSFDFSGCPVGKYILLVKQAASPGYCSVTWGSNTPSSIRWRRISGAPSLAYPPSAAVYCEFFWTGSVCYGLADAINS